MTWSLGKLHYDPGPDWLDHCCLAAAPQLDGCPAPWAMANMVWGLARLQHPPPEVRIRP